MSSESTINKNSAAGKNDSPQAETASQTHTLSDTEVIRMAGDFYAKWQEMIHEVYHARDKPGEARKVVTKFWQGFKRDLPPLSHKHGLEDDLHSGPALSTQTSEALQNYLHRKIHSSFEEKWKPVVDRLAGPNGLSYLADIHTNLSEGPVQSVSELQEEATSNSRSESALSEKSKSESKQVTPRKISDGVSDWLLQYFDNVFKPRSQAD